MNCDVCRKVIKDLPMYEVFGRGYHVECYLNGGPNSRRGGEDKKRRKKRARGRG